MHVLSDNTVTMSPINQMFVRFYLKIYSRAISTKKYQFLVCCKIEKKALNLSFSRSKYQLS